MSKYVDSETLVDQVNEIVSILEEAERALTEFQIDLDTNKNMSEELKWGYDDLAKSVSDALFDVHALYEDAEKAAQKDYDEDEEDDLVQIDEQNFEVLGTANLEDFCHKLRLDLESEDYDTIGGFLTGEFNRFPEKGEMYVTPSGVNFKVAAVDGNRITKIRVHLPEKVPIQEDLDLNGPAIILAEETPQETDENANGKL